MKLLIFDFDGVIVNTFAEAFEILKRLKQGVFTEQEFRDWFDGNAYTKMDENDPHPPDRVEQATPFFQEFIPKLLATRPVEGMPELIRKLREEDYRMVVISSTMDEPIAQYLKLHNIRSCFDKIYGASVGKDKVKKMKTALSDFQVEPSEVVLITDTLGDICEATSIGIKTIAITWGYQPLETLEKGNPLRIVQTPEELARVVDVV